MSARDAGRPTRCDDAMIGRLTQRVRDGLRFEAAVEAEGVSRRTGQNWQAWAADEQEPYCTLMRLVTQARAEFEASLLDSIRTQSTSNGDGPANEDWKARAWLLERTMPEQYAPTLALVEKAKDEAATNLLSLLRTARYPLASFADVLALLDPDSDEDEQSTDH